MSQESNEVCPLCGCVAKVGLDDQDRYAIESALSQRAMAPMPDGTPETKSGYLAEICRGWLESIGAWNWKDPIKPKE